MNERFKFRAWDKINDEWVKIPHLSLDVETGMLNGFFDYTEAAKRRYTLEQCTGLRDKNGKLIYEGDIVRSEGYPFKSDNEYHYAAEICFDEESAVFFYYVFRTSTKVAGRSHGNTGNLDDYEWEIIGNIHENPELMEKAK